MDKKRDRKVLVVEDDHCLKLVMTRVFNSIDQAIELDWTTSAEEARDALQGENYSLIVADFSLEGKSTGLDLWEICQEKYPDVPFVVISSMSVIEFYKLVGDNQISPPFLPKPFYIGECRQILKSLLGETSLAPGV